MPEKTQTQASRKPLLFAEPMYASNRRDGMERRFGAYDMWYIPRYSEERSKNELRAARGEKVTPLPHLVWVRVKHVNGEVVPHGDTQITNYMRQGAVAMPVDDLESLQRSLGADNLEMPPAAHVDQNNLIVIEDTALFWIGHQRRAENQKELDALNAELQSGALTTGSPSRPGTVYREHDQQVTIRDSLENIQKIELPD